jgi:hypothetical protein
MVVSCRFWTQYSGKDDGFPTSNAILAPVSDCAERGVEIGDQIGGRFKPDRQAQQVGRAGRAGALDRGAMLDQDLDAAERGRPLPQF